MGSRTISSTSMAATGKGALLGCCRARIGCPSAAFAIAATCSATKGGPRAAPFGSSPAGSVLTPARPLDVATIPHTSSTLGSPSSCNPPLGEVGPVAEGSSVVGAVGLATVGCSMVGATRSVLACSSLAWGARGSSARLLSSTAEGCRSFVDSTLQQTKIHQEVNHCAEEMRQIR